MVTLFKEGKGKRVRKKFDFPTFVFSYLVYPRIWSKSLFPIFFSKMKKRDHLRESWEKLGEKRWCREKGKVAESVCLPSFTPTRGSIGEGGSLSFSLCFLSSYISLPLLLSLSLFLKFFVSVTKLVNKSLKVVRHNFYERLCPCVAHFWSTNKEWIIEKEAGRA